MKLFSCQNCGQVLYFENNRCERCGLELGYLPERDALSALQPEGDAWRAMAEPARLQRRCVNAEMGGCNWLVPADGPEVFCLACQHNRFIPDLSELSNMLNWQKMEAAKRRLFYTLLRLHLPLQTRMQDPAHGLVFDFLADSPDPFAPRVMTGHENGLITLSLAEADDAERERRRTGMGEPYRTLLGHFRHEVGHHYWDVLVERGGHLDEFRALFGDERPDYGEALQRHYEQGPPLNWQEDFVSAYASAHPWEDFAESWAHYLHILDTLEMASAFGLGLHPHADRGGTLSVTLRDDPYDAPDIFTIIAQWLPLSFAMNSLNRSMGERDVYPFVLSPTVIGKLGFVHNLVHGTLPKAAPATGQPTIQQ